MQSTISRFVFFVAASTTSRARGLSTAIFKKSSVPVLNENLPTMPTSNDKTRAWCRTASVQPSGEIVLETIADADLSDSYPSSTRKIGEQVFDLTQSVDWMEYLEKIENRENDEGGAGAYDTMRCDVVLSKSLHLSKERIKVWGQDYHLQRLQKSYLSLLREKNGSTSTTSDLFLPVDQKLLKEAMEKSNQIVTKLLSEAESSVCLAETTDDILIQLFRVTLLWSNNESPRSTELNSSDSIVVRGHATSSCEPMKVHRAPEPIVVSIAAHLTDTEPTSTNDEGAKIDNMLPTRYSNPQNKIASWCRQRKQMEKPHYKPPGASEMLMVRQRLDEANKSRLEILEGLSSNFFAIYTDGTLRTATDGVLNGYVRHLVLGCTSTVGLKFDPRPIFLHDVNQWQEAFITSSSRLIYPISKVLLPEYCNESEENTFTEYWKYKSDGSTPKWQELLQEILKGAGYDQV